MSEPNPLNRTEPTGPSPVYGEKPHGWKETAAVRTSAPATKNTRRRITATAGAMPIRNWRTGYGLRNGIALYAV